MAAVQGTNDSSTLSKSSAAKAGYFKDEFIACFAGKQSRRSSLIHRGYCVRVLAVESVLLQFLRSAQGPKQIVSLGAGFDSTYFRLKSQGSLASTNYVEVDFPEVVSRKAHMIREEKKLNQVLEEPLKQINQLYTSPAYSLVGLNLERVDQLSALLGQCGVECARPTLILSECVLTYVSNQSVNKILQWSASTFTNALFVTYEQVCPEDGFGLVMQNHFQKIGSPLKCISLYPTPASQEQRYTTAGWKESVARDMHHFFYNWQSLQDRERIRRLELFDEFEELHMKSSHYVVVCSARGALTGLLPRLDPNPPPLLGCGPAGMGNNKPHPQEVATVRMAVQPEGSGNMFERYGQCSAQLPGGPGGCSRVVVFGGFGRGPHTHGRRSDLAVAAALDDGDALTVTKCHMVGNPPDKTMYCSLVALKDQKSCILFGGRSSPSSASSTSYHLHHTKDNQWQCVPIATEGGVCPQARWRHSAAVLLNESGEEVMVVHGGRNENGEVLSDFWALHLTSHSWTLLSAEGDVPAARHSASCAAWQNGMVLFGGLDSDEQPMNELFFCSLKSSAATLEKRGQSMDICCKHLKMEQSLPAKYGCSAVVKGSHLVLVGGVSWDCTTPQVVAVDLEALKWTAFTIRVNVPVLMYGLGVAVLPNKESQQEVNLFCLGGGGNCFSFGTHFNSSPFSFRLQLSVE